MSGLLNSSINGSGSNFSDNSGRSFTTSFSGQSGAPSPVYHHTGSMQGMHNIQGNFNVPNMQSALPSRNSSLTNVQSGGVQQPNGNLSSGRFGSNNLPVGISQLTHGGTLGHSGVANRGGLGVGGNPGFSGNTNGVGGSIPGILSTSAGIGNRNAVQGLGVSPMLGNAGPRISSSMGSMAGGGNLGGRSIGTGGGLSVPGMPSRLSLAANNGSGNLNVQGQNRLMSNVLPQGSSQVMSMLGNSFPSAGGPLSQNHIQAVNNMSSLGMLNDMNANDSSPFDINHDFPQLTSRPSSAGGAQGQMGSLRKQGLGPIQQNQEFSIQNEDFPALPGFKGSNADYSMDLHQKEQLHDNALSMMQSQHFSMGRPAGFNLGGSYPSHRPQPQQQHAPSVGSSGVSFSSVNNQDPLHLHGSDLFPTSHSTYHSQTGGPPGVGLRPLNSPNTVSGMGYDQLIQQYQQHPNQPQFRLQQMPAANQSFREPGIKPMQAASQSNPDPFGLLGLLSVIRMSDPDLTSLALGIDLTTLGLNLNSTENLHKTFGSPWSDEPAKSDPEFVVPQCYHAKPAPPLHSGYFSKFSVETLFYIFYSMPKDVAQLYAANELCNRGWIYHKEQRWWFTRVGEPLVKTNTYERGSYHCFDPNTFEVIRKENFVLHYDMLEKRPQLPKPM